MCTNYEAWSFNICPYNWLGKYILPPQMKKSIPILVLYDFHITMVQWLLCVSLPISEFEFYYSILFLLCVCVLLYNKSMCYLSILLAVRWLYQEEPHSNLIGKTVFNPERHDLELNAVTDWDYQQERQRTKENLMTRTSFDRAFYCSPKICMFPGHLCS